MDIPYARDSSNVIKSAAQWASVSSVTRARLFQFLGRIPRDGGRRSPSPTWAMWCCCRLPHLLRGVVGVGAQGEMPPDMLVAPTGVRRVERIDMCCPTQGLAAGEHAVALWGDDLPFDRVTGVLDLFNGESSHVVDGGLSWRSLKLWRR